jgi:hypothetical protein
VKMIRFRPWMISVLACLLLCSCDHHKTTTQNYGRFVMTKVMTYNSYFGLSRQEYAKMCRDDGELCIKCVNSDGNEPFCDLQIYADPGTVFLLYADRRKFHLVNSVTGVEQECKNLELISGHILRGKDPYWLDGNRLIVSTVKKYESSFDPNRKTYIGYEVQLGTQRCFTRQIWSYPANGYSSSRDWISPDRKGVAWTAFTEKKCLLRWFYGDYVIREKDRNCAHTYFPPDWVGDHPESRDQY